MPWSIGTDVFFSYTGGDIKNPKEFVEYLYDAMLIENRCFCVNRQRLQRNCDIDTDDEDEEDKKTFKCYKTFECPTYLCALELVNKGSSYSADTLSKIDLTVLSMAFPHTVFKIKYYDSDCIYPDKTTMVYKNGKVIDGRIETVKYIVKDLDGNILDE